MGWGMHFCWSGDGAYDGGGRIYSSYVVYFEIVFVLRFEGLFPNSVGKKLSQVSRVVVFRRPAVLSILLPVTAAAAAAAAPTC